MHECLEAGELAVIVARRTCLLAAGKIKHGMTRQASRPDVACPCARVEIARQSTDDVVINIVIAGLGGQGVLKASDILAEAAFRAGFDVKKSELHGMSQRGGSVASDVRFGGEVVQPHGAAGRGRFPGGPRAGPGRGQPLAVAQRRRADRAGHDRRARPGQQEDPERGPARRPERARSDIAEEHWLAAIRANLPEKLHEVNLAAFAARAPGRPQGVPSMIEAIEELAVRIPSRQRAGLRPRATLRELQLARLQAVVSRAYDRVDAFRKRMDERG